MKVIFDHRYLPWFAMNSDDLECFLRVATYGSLSRAAIEMGTNQSTVSRQMMRLQAAAKTRLFHRGGHGIQLTDAGHALLAYARQVTITIEEAQRAVEAFSSQGPSEAIIAAHPTIASILFGQLGLRLQRQFPNTKIRFVEGVGVHILSLLTAGEADLAILYSQPSVTGIKVETLLTEPVWLIAPPAHTHIGQSVPPQYLGQLPMILPSAPHGLRMMAESFAHGSDVSLNVIMESNTSISVTKRLVQMGCGYTLLPLAAVQDEVATGRLRAVRLEGVHAERNVVLAFSQNRAPLGHLRAITQIIRAEVTDLVRVGGWADARLASSQ